jgi:hypothetical protein
MPTVPSIATRERLTDLAAIQEQLDIPQSGAWEVHAACSGYDPDMWSDNTTTYDQEEAALVCRRECPVIQQCRARRRTVGGTGTWGGVFYGKAGGRECMRDECTNKVSSPTGDYCSFDCNHFDHAGTTRGWRLHNRYQVPMCSRCRGFKHSDPEGRGQINILTREEAHRIASTTRLPDSRRKSSSPASH